MNATRSPQRSKPAPREQLVETIVIVVLSLCLFSFCLVMFLSMQEHYHKPDTRVTREQLPTFEIPGLVFCYPTGRNEHVRFIKEYSTCWFNDVHDSLSVDYVPCQLANIESRGPQTGEPVTSPDAVFTQNVSVRYNGWETLDHCIAINPGEIIFRSDAEYVVLNIPTVQNYTTEIVDNYKSGTYERDVDAESWLLIGFFSPTNMVRDNASGSIRIQSDPHVMFAPSAIVSGYGLSFMSVDRNRFVDRHGDETWRYLANAALVQQFGWVKYLNGSLGGKTTGTTSLVLMPASFDVTTTTEYVSFGWPEFVSSVGGAFSVFSIARLLLTGRGSYRRIGIVQQVMRKLSSSDKEETEEQRVVGTGDKTTQLAIELDDDVPTNEPARSVRVRGSKYSGDKTGAADKAEEKQAEKAESRAPLRDSKWASKPNDGDMTPSGGGGGVAGGIGGPTQVESIDEHAAQRLNAQEVLDQLARLREEVRLLKQALAAKTGGPVAV